MTKNTIITVFGGTGFLGRHVVAALARTGAQIRVATRAPKRAYFLRPSGATGQIVPVFCDLHDAASVAAVLQGATHAVYLPGILFEKGKNRFAEVHAQAPERVARACKEQGLDLLVHVSALGACADAPSAYGRTKAQGEYKVIHGFGKSVVLRPSIIVGTGDHFFGMFAPMARKMGILPLIGGGKTKFQPVYVGDVAAAIAQLVTATDVSRHFGQIYELGGPGVYSFRTLLDMMQKETGSRVCYINLPFALARVAGAFASILPRPPLTVDQVRSLSVDNVVPQNSPGLKALGIAPTPLEGILPGILAAYRLPRAQC